MQCWAVQKFLPLYVGDNDLPLLSTAIGKHLENCPACRQTYQQYQTSQKSLQQLKHIHLSQAYAQIPWQTIQQAVAEPSVRPTLINSLNIKLWIPLGAATVVVLACLLWFWQEVVKRDTDFPPAVLMTKSLPSGHLPRIPTKSSLPDAAMDPRSISTFLNLPMYELNEVLPLSKRDASF
jgi:anti-sigma factor RsiW